MFKEIEQPLMFKFILIVLGFLAFCYGCAVYLPDCENNFNDDCNGTYVHGYSNGGYTSICVEDNNRR